MSPPHFHPAQIFPRVGFANFEGVFLPITSSSPKGVWAVSIRAATPYFHNFESASQREPLIFLPCFYLLSHEHFFGWSQYTFSLTKSFLAGVSVSPFWNFAVEFQRNNVCGLFLGAGSILPRSTWRSWQEEQVWGNQRKAAAEMECWESKDENDNEDNDDRNARRFLRKEKICL